MTTTIRAFDIHNAIPTGVVPFYQPIVSTSKSTEVCYEVLGRLRVNGEVLAPGQFLPSIERTPYMAKFDQAILALAIEQMGRWIHQSDQEVHLHINASAEALVRPEYVTLVQEMLQACRVNPQYLTIEVVETCTFWRSPGTLRTLTGLRKLGVNVAIDDFPCWENPGALLAWLIANPGRIQVLKLDRSLVVAACGYNLKGQPISEVEASSKLAELMQYVCFAKDLGLSVVAEGVETSEQMSIMKRCGINLLQGYGIGRPMPVEQIAFQFQQNHTMVIGTQPNTRQLCAV